jgi:hypothetical protein
MRLPLITFVAAAAAAASFASSASAATQRYATPAGSGTACTSASPCSIVTAVEGGKLDDEVIIAPGDYHLTATLQTPMRMTIHGVAGKPRPRLLFSGASQTGLRVVWGSTLRYVEVDQAADWALFASDSALVDQVIARSSGSGVTAEIQKSTIRNSIVVASGANAYAMATTGTGVANSSTYRNVTAIASGANGIAVQARSGLGGNTTLTLVNVIARGPVGLQASTDSSGAQASIIATHTNYIQPATVGSNTSIVDLGGNQTGAPVFANWQAGNYREGPMSVTENAGLADPDNGTLDVDGNVRNVGTIDIGGGELVPPPTATTGSASAVAGGSATLSGSIDGHGGATTYHFEYGATTAYGSSSSSSDAVTGTTAAGMTVSGLQPGTTYHYRLVATSTGGVAKGGDRTFTTAAAPPAPDPGSSVPPTGTAPSPSPFAGVALVSHRLTYAHRIVTVRLRCPAGTVGRCVGRTKLTRAHKLTLGRARFSIAAGGRGKVKLHVTPTGRRLLGKVSRLHARAANAAHDGAGRSKSTAAAVTIHH